MSVENGTTSSTDGGGVPSPHATTATRGIDKLGRAATFVADLRQPFAIGMKE
jgi:hypothetical protein